MTTFEKVAITVGTIVIVDAACKIAYAITKEVYHAIDEHRENTRMKKQLVVSKKKEFSVT